MADTRGGGRGLCPQEEADPAGDTDVDRVDLGPLDALVGYHLRRAANSLRVDYARTVEESGLRQVFFGILSVIAANPGMNQGKVARVLGIPRPNMVALVNELIGRGLVVRAADATDRRAFALRVTAAGTAEIEVALGRIRDHEDRMMRDIGAGGRAALIRILAQIQANGAG